MQNRYAADVGDFGKIGMLRKLEKKGLKVGVNWYLVEDESHNEDGKHISYLENCNYVGCDDELRESLKQIIINKNRSVQQLEELKLLQSTLYYHKILKSPLDNGKEYRDKWHKDALSVMKECDIVFLDPDNGLLPKSVSKGSKKSIKYVFEEEIVDYYVNGCSVVFYNHRCREKVDVYLKRFENIFKNRDLSSASIKGVSFVRGTIRDYIYLVQPQHEKAVNEAINELFSTAWNKHFEYLVENKDEI